MLKKLLLSAGLFVASVTAASACPCYSLGADAAGFAYRSGSEYAGSRPAAAVRFEFGSTDANRATRLGAVGATGISYSDSTTVTSFHLDTRTTTWTRPGGTPQSTAQFAATKSAAVAQGATVRPLARPVGMLQSGLPNIIGYTITGRNGGPTTTYSVRVSDSWKKSVSYVAADPGNDGQDGCYCGGGN